MSAGAGDTYSADEIYRFARHAGFSPDQAVTMTAVALAESGGRSRAHNPDGEDSRGLWQINLDAHDEWASKIDLGDPLQNAQAAFRVSGGGASISPWTVTHQSRGAPYTKFREQALQAAATNGEPATGVWNGSPGYGNRVSAGSPSNLPPPPLPAVHDRATADGLVFGAGEGHHTRADDFVEHALDQSGDPYVWGSETSPDDADPDAFDCSELAQWAAGRVGVTLPDGSWLQYLELKQQGRVIPVEDAIHTKGALLFSFSSEPTMGGGRPSKAHVAISVGDGQTIEARGAKYGVGSWETGERFQYAAVIPGLEVATPGAAIDSDGDGLLDEYEVKQALDPHSVDTDHDGLSDAYELTNSHTNATIADTDHDEVLDSIEIAIGTDPNSAEGLVGADYALTTPVDSDGDRLPDNLELVANTDVHDIDSDDDGLTDYLEYTMTWGDPAASPTPGMPGQAGDLDSEPDD